jgi:predicted nucleic-acid-binding Zn-ribbon protein
MERFDKGRSCPKCGAVGARIEYHARSRIGTDKGACRLMEDDEMEHVHRICESCTYHWAEAPLDAELSD